jgi:tetratricopeptide (TPR) repeat protein
MNQEIKPEFSISPWPDLTRKQWWGRVAIFLLCLIFIDVGLPILSKVLVQFGNFEYSTGHERLGEISYNLALGFDDDLKEEVNQCYRDNSEGNYESAIEHCNKAIDINENYGSSYFYRGYAHWKLQQYDLAVADFSRDIELIPVATRSYINRGAVYMEQDKYDLAIIEFTKSIEINPNEPQAWLNRGLTNVYQGQYEQAISDCNQAVELRDYWNPYYCLGLAFFGQQNFDLAIKNFDKAIEFSPGSPSVYFMRGSIYERQGRQGFAITDYTNAIDVDPNYGPAYTHRGYIYAQQKSFDLAMPDFDRALQIDPNNFEAYLWRGNAFADMEMFPQAIEDYQKAIILNANTNPYVYCVQGVTFMKMGNFQAAVSSLEQAQKIEGVGEYEWCRLALDDARQRMQ